MVMVHFTPTILANPLHCTLICTPRLKQQLAHNPFCSVFVKLAEFESRTRGKRIATWRVNAQAVNEELHSAEELRAQLEALRQEAERVRNRGIQLTSPLPASPWNPEGPILRLYYNGMATFNLGL